MIAVLRFLWRSVLVADRLLRMVPSLVQVWLVEFFFVIPLAFFIGKVIDIRGAWGYPGTGESLDAAMWGTLVVSLAAGFFFVKNLIFPRVKGVEWTPTHASGPIIGGVGLVVSNPRATVEYPFLSSHPAYSLLLLITFWIPFVMVAMTENQGGNTLYFRATGAAGLWILAGMAVARFVAWYVFGLGRTNWRAWAAEHSVSTWRLGWEMAWRPTLVLVTLMHAIVWIPMGIMFWNEYRTIRALPLASVAMGKDAPDPYVFDSGTPRLWCRVEGKVIGEPVWWPATGENRGGDNYRGMGVQVALDTGGEVLLLAESLSVPDLIGDLKKAEKNGGRIAACGYMTNAIGDNQTKYYGFRLADFPPPDPAGRVLITHGYP